MARDVWKQYMPREIERLTYVLYSSCLLLAITVLWQPIDDLIWAIRDPVLSKGIYTVGILGGLLSVGAIVAIDPFELIGLRQSGIMTSRDDQFHLGILHSSVRHPL